jgi:hypothetical protein
MTNTGYHKTSSSIKYKYQRKITSPNISEMHGYQMNRLLHIRRVEINRIPKQALKYKLFRRKDPGSLKKNGVANYPAQQWL